jgi:hypothetical protein
VHAGVIVALTEDSLLTPSEWNSACIVRLTRPVIVLEHPTPLCCLHTYLGILILPNFCEAATLISLRADNTAHLQMPRRSSPGWLRSPGPEACKHHVAAVSEQVDTDRLWLRGPNWSKCSDWVQPGICSPRGCRGTFPGEVLHFAGKRCTRRFVSWCDCSRALLRQASPAAVPDSRSGEAIDAHSRLPAL